MFSKVWVWLATRAASAWIAAGAFALVGTLGIYVQQLRVEAARCESIDELRQQVEGFKKEIKRERAEDYADIRESLQAVEDSCLDQPSPIGGLRDNP